mgnify:CR=1 FL=1|jgi:GR25 family glycosyltransferase involved in LPS biosynthesis|tara:strand:+ start:455 stop:1195 length:741 start_codon:yes stop_codon:yes gene_type:complete
MSSEISNLKCFIIHLKRAKKRKIFVENIIKNIFMDTEVIYAVDGKLLSDTEINNIVDKNKFYSPKYPFKINSGEIGCFLSHRKAWKKIVDQRLDAGLILEDDISIDPNIFNQSISFASKYIKDYKFIQFQVRKLKKDSNLKLLRPLPSFLRTSAQLVSYEAAIELLERTKNIDRPIDTTLQMFWETKIKCFCINESGITDHTFEAGGSTLSEKKPSQLEIRRNIKRLIYRIKIIYISKYKKFRETL